MATYQTYNFPECRSGDTFGGVQFALTINAAAPSLAGSLITMKVSDKIYSTETNEIEILDGGIFRFKEQVINLPAYNHPYNIRIRFADGKTKTYIRGNWLITK